jgi:DNA-directed RNA polymerase subunit RPC12/RpoP
MKMPDCSPVLKMGCLNPQPRIVRAMSEFKYACPVCGQHIKCDSTQSGTTMECPTCFQKIVVPQAPASDNPKFIITGKKVGAERPLPTAVVNAAAAPLPAPQKSSLVPAILLGVLVCVAAALLFAFRGKIFKPAGGPPPPPGGPVATGTPPKPPKAPLVAPPASDNNWTLDLATAVIPDAPVAGRIHGEDFIIERAIFQNGTLTFRAGTRGAVEFGVLINFSGAQAESLSGQSIHVATNADKAANIILRWKDNDQQHKENFNDRYTMRLEFDQLSGNRLPGKIYLCTPDTEKSYVAGTFRADVRKTKPKP